MVSLRGFDGLVAWRRVSLASASSLFVGGGLQTVLFPGPLERGERLWRLGRGGAVSGLRVGAPSLALTNGGALLAWGGTF